jgi:hypothetical protein
VEYRTRKQATEYVRAKGIPLGNTYLAQCAINGTGPKFQCSGRYAVYKEKDLDSWVKARLRSPTKSPLGIKLDEASIDARAEAMRSTFAELANLGHKPAARELNKRGIKTAAGKAWHATQVMRIRERLALIDARNLSPKRRGRRALLDQVEAAGG